MSLTFKEKELVNIGASVATGCKPCTDYHFTKVRVAGASDDEIRQAISDALAVRDSAKEIMENHGLKQLGITKGADSSVAVEEAVRIRQLVSVGAAFAVNCTTSLERQIAVAKSIGVTDDEIRSVLDAAQFIKGEAAHYVGEIAKLTKEKDELQELLDELERTQAQLVQSEKMAALGKIVAGVVHEMNTPIGAIKSATDTFSRSAARILETVENSNSLEEMKDNREFRAALKTLLEITPVAEAASGRVTIIVNSLKSFVHLDEATFQEADLHRGLDDTLTLLEHLFGAKIRVVKAYGDIPRVVCNPGELNQVFISLLTNAAEAIQSEGTITIRTFVKDDDVHIQILDTGVGISQERQKGLFEPGFTRKGSRVKAGLGLFTSYSILQRHGGGIEVESEVGEGSQFTIRLPIHYNEPNRPGHRCDG